MNYDEMPAGPEMDRLIAEKVMGWEPMEWLGSFRLSPCKFRWTEDDGSVHAVHTFLPSTNIAHAWEVVEHMNRHFLLSQDDTTCDWTAEFHGAYRPQGEKSAHADTAPLAICRAALKALNAR